MKLRKTIVLLLILLPILSLLSACDNSAVRVTGKAETTVGTTAATRETLTFTAVVAASPDNNMVTVEVCEAYQAQLGKYVLLTTTDACTFDLSNLRVGFEVRVVTSNILREGMPQPLVSADSVEILTVIVTDLPDIDYSVAEKPVLYLYPQADTVCSVRLQLAGELTCTYPAYGKDGWQNFVARPDGTLLFPDGSEYYCLYWEGNLDITPDLSRGFCVKGSETAAFLADILPKIGLNAREANEFIIYWLPRLQENPYNLISFQGAVYEDAAKLEISPAPDSLLRVYMTAKGLDAPVEIEPQVFAGFDRHGFTVVEWGGSIIE